MYIIFTALLIVFLHCFLFFSSASSNNEENKDIQQILEARIKKEKALRLAQISERKENKILAQQQQLAIEKKEIEKIKKLTLDDEEKKNYKREQQKKMFDAVKEEDDRNRMMKEARLQSQREYEFKLSKDYEYVTHFFFPFFFLKFFMVFIVELICI